ncbi:MAG: hypothetical protein LCH26_04770 [Proteobacteria bacterium]|nr:hypothetical protein [Pseudomonadota bacterium]
MGTFTAATLLAFSPVFATTDAVQEGPLTKQQTQELDKAQQNIKKLTQKYGEDILPILNKKKAQLEAQMKDVEGRLANTTLEKTKNNINKKLTAIKNVLAEVEKTIEVAIKKQKEAGEKKGAGDAKPADTPTEHTDKKDAAPEATGDAAVAPAAEAQ